MPDNWLFSKTCPRALLGPSGFIWTGHHQLHPACITACPVQCKFIDTAHFPQSWPVLFIDLLIIIYTYSVIKFNIWRVTLAWLWLSTSLIVTCMNKTCTHNVTVLSVSQPRVFYSMLCNYTKNRLDRFVFIKGISQSVYLSTQEPHVTASCYSQCCC